MNGQHFKWSKEQNPAHTKRIFAAQNWVLSITDIIVSTVSVFSDENLTTYSKPTVMIVVNAGRGCEADMLGLFGGYGTYIKSYILAGGTKQLGASTQLRPGDTTFGTQDRVSLLERLELAGFPTTCFGVNHQSPGEIVYLLTPFYDYLMTKHPPTHQAEATKRVRAEHRDTFGIESAVIFAHVPGSTEESFGSSHSKVNWRLAVTVWTRC